ncbi:MAG: hypothetical protein E7447_04845 [Ruminococcaceae bacterium]|nr:hypothetical protein [Oscillospiraceae bacterium]
MSKKQIVVVFVVAIILIGLCIMIPAFQAHSNISIYIFEDISECNALVSSNEDGGNFTKYQNAEQDENLENLQYVQSFAGKYTCDRYTFEIFAYAFADPASARTYFENITGKNSYTLEENFSISSGLTSSRIIVFKGNMAYAVYCPARDLDAISEVLENCFQVKIK